MNSKAGGKAPSRLAAAAAALSLAACTMVGHVKTEGWPVLEVTEHQVSWTEVIARCSKYVGIFWPPLACAEIYLQERKCAIWYVLDAHLEHERLHCQGYDHFGGDTFAKIMQQEKERQSDK